MAYESATSVLELLTLVIWSCLCVTKYKSGAFSIYLTSEDVVSTLLVGASLSFAPGLLDVIQSATPPVDFFRSLPTEVTEAWRWAVYALVLEKPNSIRLGLHWYRNANPL